ncbi:MetQ/NlpA family ABC transporter substrate-binding protein [Agromyces archimandritae]|uniref:Lipoprotein n=1 Tax=Agromyces archimandritae TaxID=2781962 RepID=A0A975FKJ4_9MICO|nr:MetQ/NlpA family ABC transporter substrate-binding protein [Agromyces archimandritae]QTX03774.1 ABC transporter [Agromyces archimandritae]
MSPKPSTRLRILGLGAAATLALGLSACASTDDTAGGGEVELSTPFKVAATDVPHGDILAFVKENLAEDAGIDFEIVSFTDYPLGNQWLSEGEVDANYFQHRPYLDAQIEEFGYEIEPLSDVHVEPYAAFSEKYDSVADLPDGAKISVTNDASNQERALDLLAQEGLIELPEDGEVSALVIENSAEYNPHGFDFIEADPASQARALPDVDLGILNGNYFLDAGYSLEDALIVEPLEGNVYANFLAARTDNADDPRIQKLDELLTSPEVKAYIEETWPGGDVSPAF